MVAGVAPDHINISGAIDGDRREEVADRTARRIRKNVRREGEPRALTGIHMADDDLDVVRRGA